MNPAHHIIILGAGIVGATLADCAIMRNLLLRITLIDPDPKRLAAIPSHPRLSATPNLDASTPPAHLYFIAVGTPSAADGACHTAEVEKAVRAAMQHATGAATIAIKSTVPPGTAQRLNVWSNHILVSNPEFLTQANAHHDLLHPARVLIGAEHRRYALPVIRFWREVIGVPSGRIQLTDTRTAEAAKYVANAMLAARVAHFNELNDWAESEGADPCNLALAVGADPRIGPIHASSGYAGRCLPKDVGHLLARHASDLPALDAIHALNQHRLQRHSQA